MTPEVVPGPRWTAPTGIPHVLVLGARYDDDDRDWEVEHPPECGRSCPWWPEARRTLEVRGGLYMGFDLEVGIPSCYVEFEVEACALDSLAGEVFGIDCYAGGWRRLPTGRYLIEGWFQPFYWAGSMPIDAEGGISIVGPERPRWYDRLRRSRLRADLRLRRHRLRSGFAFNVPRARVALRGPAIRAYYSERNRKRCVVLPLGGGWRIVVQRRRPLP